MYFRYVLFLLITAVFINSTFALNTDTRSDSIDITQTSIKLDLSQFQARVLYGATTVSFRTRVNGINYINLDLLGLQVDSVKSNGVAVNYRYSDSVIHISLPTALAAGQSSSVTVYYHGTPIQMAGDFGGFYWTSQYAFNIGVSFLADPKNYGKVWFPCFDNFIERCSFTFAITTDSTRRALCNGSLVSTTQDPVTRHKTYTWQMSEEIPSYLASVTVSDYALLLDTFQGLQRVIPIILAARSSDTANLKGSFRHLKNALSIFEDRWGPYHFNRVGYCIVPFNAGAMEHATNISYMQAIVNGNTSYENFMAHELSHHWFGDLATCDNENEMWLNEGWARYCESIFYEGMYGKAKYKDETRKTHENVIRLAHVIDSAYWPVSGVPSQLTYSNYTIYDKGSDRVHTLRGYMGDSLFFHCVRAYLQQYQFKDVNSDKLRDFLKQCSGLNNLDAFFSDWIKGGGYPDFTIADESIIPKAGSYRVAVRINQKVNHSANLFTQVPLEIAYFDTLGNKTVRVASISGACTDYSTSLNFAPVYIALDFDEKLSDNVTDYWLRMAGSGSHDMGVAKMLITASQGTDSSLVRVEHHWLAPDANMNSIAGLYLSDYRYWTVDGIWAADFAASALIKYNGSTNQSSGYLDNTFITNTEDSLAVLYRPDSRSQWQLEPNVNFNIGSKTDKVGSVTINNLQKGQYCLAIYDARRADTSQSRATCSPLSVQEIKDNKATFKVYPNPLRHGEMTVEITAPHQFVTCAVLDMQGRVLLSQPIAINQSTLTLSMKGINAGSYLVQLLDTHNQSISKTIVKLN